MKRLKVRKITQHIVREQTWAPNDSYLMVDLGKWQLLEIDGWKKGDEVRATVTIELVRRGS
jgi:hypothetical protein